MAARKVRRYTVEERRRAVKEALEVGLVAASEKLGIPKGTLSCWVFLSRQGAALTGGVPVSMPEPCASPATEPSESLPERRPVLAVEVAPAAPVEPPTPTPTPSKPAARVARIYTPSQRAEILEYAAKHGPSATHEKFGASRFSIHDWQRKTAAAAAGGAAPAPTTGPDTNPADERERRVLQEWRAHPGLGPSQVRNQLRRAGFKISVHSVRVVMEAHGYVTPTIRREAADNFYEATRPNALWHLDFLHRYVHKQLVYVLLLIDDYSRFIVGAALWDGERVGAVIETFEASITRHGRPEKAMSDGGSAFYAWKGIGQFTRLLEELEVDQLIAKKPQSNGKLENLNANIQKELFNVEKFFDLAEAQRRLHAWVSFYNFRRTHHALGGLLVPADRYFGRSDEVLAQLEAGHGIDGTHLIGEPLPVGERMLDLFRVTSRAGQLEIWLMGQPLLVQGKK
jgi:transposase InsO family protein/transposase-like protein